jgi:prepilin-type N-terminal cleavage/methylation domain-containing protein
MKSKKNSSRLGFSLIELLISISIMTILVGGGIVSYINFNEKQRVIGAAREVQTYLRTAQTKARVGDVPDGCDHLEGYSIRALGGDNALRLVAVCETGEVEINQYEINPNVNFDQAVDVTFANLHGGVSGAQSISLTGSNLSYEFAVTQGGEITEGDYEN